MNNIKFQVEAMESLKDPVKPISLGILKSADINENKVSSVPDPDSAIEKQLAPSESMKEL